MDIASLMSLLFTAISSVLIARWIEKKNTLPASLVGVSILACGFFLATELIRDRFEDVFEKRIEGDWVTLYHNADATRLCGVGSFRYNSRTRLLDFSGIMFSADGDMTGTWDSREVLSRPGDLRVYYLSEVEELSSLSDDAAEDQQVEGFGYIKFDSETASSNGHGTFRQFDTDSSPVKFLIRRITAEQSARYIQKDRPLTMEDKLDFALKYLEEVATRKRERVNSIPDHVLGLSTAAP